MEWDLPQLRCFAAIVEHGSLDAAASALHITPSAVSQRLKALETSVGAVLLQRSRPARPTLAGLPVLRLAREINALTEDASVGADQGPVVPRVRVAVNADSMETWVLRALAPLAAEIQVELLRADQERTTDLLRDGSAMAAITSSANPVQGCTVAPLGTMRYRPYASAAFAARHFAQGVSQQALAKAPHVVYDEHDELQKEALARRGLHEPPPIRHVVPGSWEFASAIRLGYGWGMLPDQQIPEIPESELVSLDPAGDWLVDVALFWQQWSLQTPSLDAVAAALRSAAAEELADY